MRKKTDIGKYKISTISSPLKRGYETCVFKMDTEGLPPSRVFKSGMSQEEAEKTHKKIETLLRSDEYKNIKKLYLRYKEVTE